ncbi:PREDICTED: leucine-rich repeat and transmembrane domain-containing protein 2-like isoform X2 [Eufriesea mexicana]|uniref:leucine-rich repeat and transmembrane domain-containing protein 2-like isoform X2 n=1 Tax=Eufriesea mexicana TaxID=516756 RepID=UPI00083C3C16|nr:PREDICTED: leucine-rich repeat and transmembrane domain-containing protein 2-like isoform X2 [Eufriesea mexicana]
MGFADMSVSLMNGLLMLGVVAAIMPGTMVVGFSGATLVMDQDIPSRTCRYSRAYSMIQVRCSNLHLEWIPTNLKTEIQILDASVNRLRVLTNDSLSAYTSLAYLYLGDNFIQEIQEAAFDSLHYLKVLDLSTNGCDTLPKSLFRLPYLQKIYLYNNKLTDDLFKRIEVTSPLAFLQLARNRLGKIPEMGAMPTLVNLNVSDNAISSVSPEDLAPFCSLKILDVSKNPIKFDANNCECQTLNAWIYARGIRSRPVFNCTEEQERGCAQPAFSNRTIQLYDRCTEILRLQVETEKARTTWILIACCISGFLFCLFISLFCVHKRNKRRKKKLKEEQRLNANNANTELLNSNLNQPENT